MTTPAKLYAWALSNPRSVTFRDFKKLLRAFGFVYNRTTGSHEQYVHPLVPRPLPIQPSGHDAKLYQVRQFLDIVEEYGLSLKE